MKDSIAYFAVRAINGSLALAVLATLTRLLEPQQYGAYAMGMAAVSVTAAVLFQWLSSAVLRFHASSDIAADELLTVVHRLFYRVAIIAALGTAFVAVLLPVPGLSSTFVMVVGAGAVALALQDIHLQVAIARRQPWRYGAITASRGVALLFLATAMIYLGFAVEGALGAMCISCLLAVWLFGARWSWMRRANRRSLPRELVRYGMPVALASGMTMVFSFADRFLIGWWHGAGAVAGYAAAYDLAQQTVGVVLNVFFMVSYPRVTAAWESGGLSSARIAVASLQRALLLVAPLAVGLFAGLADEIAAFMFGGGIRNDAAAVIPIIALATAIGCTKAFLLDVPFHLTRSTSMLMRISGLMAALSIGLNVFLVSHYSFLGAAVGSLATFFGGALLGWWFGRSEGLYPQLPREVFKSAVCLVSMLTTYWLIESVPLVTRVGDGLAKAGLLVALGLIAFAVVAWLIDLSQLRTQLVRFRRSPADGRR